MRRACCPSHTAATICAAVLGFELEGGEVGGDFGNRVGRKHDARSPAVGWRTITPRTAGCEPPHRCPQRRNLWHHLPHGTARCDKLVESKGNDRNRSSHA